MAVVPPNVVSNAGWATRCRFKYTRDYLRSFQTHVSRAGPAYDVATFACCLTLPSGAVRRRDQGKQERASFQRVTFRDKEIMGPHSKAQGRDLGPLQPTRRCSHQKPATQTLHRGCGNQSASARLRLALNRL